MSDDIRVPRELLEYTQNCIRYFATTYSDKTSDEACGLIDKIDTLLAGQKAAVEFSRFDGGKEIVDLSPAMREGAIRDKLIELGWVPPLAAPPAAQPTGGSAKPVSDAMVERAVEAYFTAADATGDPGCKKEHIRAALEAAVAPSATTKELVERLRFSIATLSKLIAGEECRPGALKLKLAVANIAMKNAAADLDTQTAQPDREATMPNDNFSDPRFAKAGQDFAKIGPDEACGMCGHKGEQSQKAVAWMSQGGDVSRSKKYLEDMGFTDLIPLHVRPSAAAQPDSDPNDFPLPKLKSLGKFKLRVTNRQPDSAQEAE